MVRFTATAVDMSEEDELLTVQFSARGKYLQFVRDVGESPVNPTYYIEVNDQGGGGYGWAASVKLHRDKVVVQAAPDRKPELGCVEVAFKTDKRRFNKVAAALERIFVNAPGVFAIGDEAASDTGGR